jgi:hypothetical protein
MRAVFLCDKRHFHFQLNPVTPQHKRSLTVMPDPGGCHAIVALE